MVDVAVKVYRQRFTTLLPAVAVVVVPVSILTTIVDLSIPDSVFSSDFAGTGETYTGPDGGEVAAGFAAFLVSTMLTWLAIQVATAACFEIVGGVYVQRTPTWRESLASAASRLRSLIWLQIVFGLSLLLAFVACVGPAVHFYVAFAVATPVLLFEGVKGKAALGRSRRLIKGRWWPTFGVLILVFILTGIVQGALSALLVAVVLGGGGELVSTLTGGVGTAVATVLTTPFAAAVTTVIYFDALVRKEGFDLLQLARGIGVDPPEGWAPDPASSLVAPELAWEEGDEPPFWPPPPGWKPRSRPDA